MKRLVLILALLSLPATAATPKPDAPAKAKNTKNRAHDFDSQVVEGEVYRPDYSVVTGDAPGEGWGVLRLRPDFDDHKVSDNEETKAEGKKR